MSTNPLRKLNEYGQSVWLDYIRRLEYTDGRFKRLVEEDGVSGVTANPTIFEKAIGGFDDYDEAIARLAREGKSPYEIYVAVGTDDIRTACTFLRPAYDRTNALDGYACIEVAPSLADDVQGTVAEAHRFVELVGLPNVMPKVPATVRGLEAIEQLTYEGICVNVTLIFSVQRYEGVMEAYIRGLGRRAQEGKSTERITSVASFFVSRIDTAVDKMLEDKMAAADDPQMRAECTSLLGKAAVANAKIAYERFEAIFKGDRFASLAAQGALVQRPLWASTGTKNPNYSDVLYIEELVGQETVNTMPPTTMDAFRDHGNLRSQAIEENLDEAHSVIERLAKLGIDLGPVTDKLEQDGVKSFSDSFDNLIKVIEDKSRSVAASQS